jgi:hypothetical protein
MNHISYIQYFERIAASHKEINHDAKTNPRFVLWTNDAFASGLNSMKGAFMVINEGSGSFTKLGEGYVDTKRASFEIHVEAGNWSSDPLIRVKAIDKAERIGKQIIAKMIEDSEDYDPAMCPRELRQFRAETVIYENFDSMAPNFVTTLFSFTIQDDNYLEHQEDVWQ